MSNFGLLSRGSSGTDSNQSTPFTMFSRVSEDSLQVPPPLYIRDVTVDPKAVRGSGSYGTVFVAKWHQSQVAAKKLHDIFFERMVTPESKTGILRSFAREVNMLIQLKHPNIVQFYGVYSESQSAELTADTYLVQELMSIALDVRNRQSQRLNLRNVIDISLNIVSGLRYLHDRPEPIIHRDLACKNILLNSVGVAKIADLGVAKILDESTTPQSRLPGTELYMPPEVKIEGMAYDTKVDIYSLGVVIMEMCIGRDAKANEAFRVTADRSIVLTPEFDRRKSDFDSLGNHLLRPVIVSCLDRRELRPTAKDISVQLFTLSSTQSYQNCPDIPIIPQSATLNNDLSFRQLSARCEMIEEKAQTLQRDKEFLQTKLDSYLAGDNSDGEIDKLMAENAHLQSLLAKREAEFSEFTSLRAPPSSREQDRDQRATLLQKLTEVQETKKQEIEHLQKQVVTMHEDNSSLRQELRVLRGHFQPDIESGHTSLPEQLPSFKTQRQQHVSNISMSADQLPTLKELSLTSTEVAPNLSEFRKVKKQLDKYKTVNVEMDQKLKEARVELKKYAGCQGNAERTEVNRLRSDTSRLQAQLNYALGQNSHLQSQLRAALSMRRY